MVRYVRVLANLLFLRTVWEAAVAALWTFVLIRYIVFELVSSFALFYAYQPHPEQLESLARFASGVGAALLLALFVALGSRRATREDSRRALERGALIGTTSVVLLNGMVAIWFPPVDSAEVALQLPAAIAGGLLGAARGRRRRAVAEAVYRARLAIARARRCEDIVAAIGENLLEGFGKTGEVLLWRVTPSEEPLGAPGDSSPVVYELCAAWPARAAASWPIGLRLAKADAFAALEEGGLYTKSIGGLPGNLQQRLSPLGSALLAPLSTGGEPVGLLMVALSRRGRSAERACLDAASLVEQQLTIFRKEECAERAGVRGERERLADEIHDTVIQGCIAVGNRIEDILGTDRLDSGERKELARALKISRDTVEEARLSIRALNTDDFSKELPQLLAGEVEDFWGETGIRVRMLSRGEPFPLPPHVGVALFKAAREGLTNVRKHARATSSDLVLTYGSRCVSLEVRDYGTGPNGLAHDGSKPEAALKKRLREGGHGLWALRRLVHKAGGSLSVGGVPGGGTVLSVRFEIGPSSPGRIYYPETLPTLAGGAPAGGDPD